MELFFSERWRKSWSTLHSRGWEYLRRNGPVPEKFRHGQPHHGLPRLRLWHDPGGLSVEVVPTSWTVFELFTAVDVHEPIVRKCLWNETADFHRLHTMLKRNESAHFPEPTVTEEYALVPREEFENLLRAATGFRVPVIWFSNTESVTSGPTNEMGFEFFSRDQPPASLRMNWSDHRPASWQPLIECYRRMQELLERALQNPLAK